MLVDGYGNFGSIDGDPPAAYRYTCLLYTSGKGRDLRHDVLREHHEAAERLTDDGIQSDEDGEGQEAPEAAAHRCV